MNFNPYLIGGGVFLIFVMILFFFESSNNQLRKALANQQTTIKKLEYEKRNLDFQIQLLKLSQKDSALYEKIQNNRDSVRAAFDFFK
jgi:peptidoglycan hydrolase CwlO-like protein